jgi:hypothetical protein
MWKNSINFQIINKNLLINNLFLFLRQIKKMEKKYYFKNDLSKIFILCN